MRQDLNGASHKIKKRLSAEKQLGIYPSQENAGGIYLSFKNNNPRSAKEKADLPRDGDPEERQVIAAETSENYHCHHQRQWPGVAPGNIVGDQELFPSRFQFL